MSSGSRGQGSSQGVVWSFGGRYLELTPHERIRYTDKFDDPNLPGEMQVTVTLKKVSCGTELNVVKEGVPDVIPAGAKWIAQHGAGATIVLRNREMTDMLAAAASGQGLAVLPCMLAEAEPALRRLTDEVLGTHRMSLVYRREMLRGEPIRKVIAFVAGVMRAHADRLSGVRR